GEPGRAPPQRLCEGGRALRQGERGGADAGRAAHGDPGALAGDAVRARDAVRGEEMTTAARATREVTMHVFRGDGKGGEFHEYRVPLEEGMVVLDVIPRIQGTAANDLAVRWNCKAGKCGSCSAEVNGKPRLMCMTRMDLFDPQETITLPPMQRFPIIGVFVL